MNFINRTQFDFTDISSEAWREYQFQGGQIVRIDRPFRLHVSDDGGHRVFDEHGVSHYIPSGWIHLSWKAREGEPHFVL
jgi:hypothetical protein